VAGALLAGRRARLGAALGVGVAEGTVMAAWTALVRAAFGARRFGMNLAVYNSAIAVGSAGFNGLAAALVAGAIARVGAGAGGAMPEDVTSSGAAAGYRIVFAVASGACAVAAGLGMVLTGMLKRDHARDVSGGVRGLSRHAHLPEC